MQFEYYFNKFMEKQKEKQYVEEQYDLIKKADPVVLEKTVIQQIYGEYFNFFHSLDLKKYESMNENRKQDFGTLDETNNQAKIQLILKCIRAECILMLKDDQFKVDDQQNSIESIHNLNQAPFEITLVKNMVTWQVVEIYCQLGPFSKQFIVLNCPETIQYCNHLYNDQFYHDGSWGTKIFIIHQDNTTYAQKRIPFHSPNNQQIQISTFKDGKPTFMKVLKQFFIASMMSAIEVGPYLTKINGFDFNLSEGFIEFNMEVCQRTHRSDFLDNLKLNLLKMHSLKICHSDIAPKNIMFSVNRQKSIFIDFGISNMIKQEIHEKTYTSFFGTYGYTLPELSQLAATKIQRYVNMYSNDIYGLNKSLNQLKVEQKQKQQPTIRNKKLQNLNLYDKYRKICTLCKVTIAENTPSENIFGFTNPRIEKTYQYKILLQRCKFTIYCRNIYFKCAKNSDSKDQISEKNLMLFQIEGVTLYCQQLNIFDKVFDQFYPYQQLIKQYEDYYYLSMVPGNSIDIKEQIAKWQVFYKAFDPTNRINLNDFTEENLITLTQTFQNLQNPEILKSILYQREKILNYFIKLIFIADFTSHNKILNENLKFKIFQTYCRIRKQVLTQIDPHLFYHYCGKNKQNTQYFPNHLYQSMYPLQIIQFYDDILKLALQQNDTIENHNIKFQLKALILQLGFKILKNFIFLGFNYFQFLKDYIKKCLEFIMKDKNLQNHLILIMTREIIELGFFIDYALIHCIKWEGPIIKQEGTDNKANYLQPSKYTIKRWPVKIIRQLIKSYFENCFLFDDKLATTIIYSWIISETFKFCEYKRQKLQSSIQKRVNLILFQKKFNYLKKQFFGSQSNNYLFTKQKENSPVKIVSKFFLIIEQLKIGFKNNTNFYSFKMNNIKTVIFKQKISLKQQQVPNQLEFVSGRNKNTVKYSVKAEKYHKLFQDPRNSQVVDLNKIIKENEFSSKTKCRKRLTMFDLPKCLDEQFNQMMKKINQKAHFEQVDSKQPNQNQKAHDFGQVDINIKLQNKPINLKNFVLQSSQSNDQVTDSDFSQNQTLDQDNLQSSEMQLFMEFLGLRQNLIQILKQTNNSQMEQKALKKLNNYLQVANRYLTTNYQL